MKYNKVAILVMPTPSYSILQLFCLGQALTKQKVRLTKKRMEKIKVMGEGNQVGLEI